MGRLRLLGEQEGGGTDDHSALSNLDYAQSGHSGFVPSQGEALIDILRLNQNLIRDSEGNDRLQLATSAPHITLTGRCKITQETAIGGIAPVANTLLKLQFLSNPTSNVFTGLAGMPGVTLPSGNVGGLIEGLNYTVILSGGGGGATLPFLRGLTVALMNLVFTGTIADMVNMYSYPPSFMMGAPAVTTFHSFWAPASASNKIVDAYGVHVEDITLNTGFTRLLELGPATPYLRVVGGGDPPSDKSNLYLKFGSTLYRVVKSGSYMTLEAA